MLCLKLVFIRRKTSINMTKRYYLTEKKNVYKLCTMYVTLLRERKKEVEERKRERD